MNRGNFCSDRAPYQTSNPQLNEAVDRLLEQAGIDQDRDIYREMMMTVLKFWEDKPRHHDLLQFNRATKEWRYGNRVFQPYDGIRKISIFGSARTPPDAPEYRAARDFAARMRESGFMIITGGGEGIMGAAQEGATAERSFALNIKLPFEQRPNKTIAGDPKLINFNYFFTRKLNFVKHSDAVALFPGGFGTMDEGFEALTLIQTGKTQLVPVVMIDAPGGNFWKTFVRYIKEHLLRDGLISPEDLHLFKTTDNLDEARKEVLNFYYNFHSYRWVGETCVLRLQREIPAGALRRLESDFADILVGENPLRSSLPLPEEINQPELSHLPRLCVNWNRRSYGRFRQLIDRVNLF